MKSKSLIYGLLISLIFVLLSGCGINKIVPGLIDSDKKKQLTLSELTLLLKSKLPVKPQKSLLLTISHKLNPKNLKLIIRKFTLRCWIATITLS